jgi:hypothetical protein
LFKFKLFLQKSFFRLIMLAAFIAFCGVFYYAVQTEKRVKDPENMRLPAGIEFGKATVGGDAQNNALAIQHLGSREAAMELSEIVAEVMTFNKNSFRGVMVNSKKYFTDEGYKQYSQFLINSNFETMLSGQDLQTGIYMDGNPVELGRGVYGGVFKWFFEMPVTISLIPRESETYRNEETKPQNRSFILRVQYARVNDPQDPNAVKIELWQVLPPRPKK